jgi:hypothetical protein
VKARGETCHPAGVTSLRLLAAASRLYRRLRLPPPRPPGRARCAAARARSSHPQRPTRSAPAVASPRRALSGRPMQPPTARKGVRVGRGAAGMAAWVARAVPGPSRYRRTRTCARLSRDARASYVTRSVPAFLARARARSETRSHTNGRSGGSRRSEAIPTRAQRGQARRYASARAAVAPPSHACTTQRECAARANADAPAAMPLQASHGVRVTSQVPASRAGADAGGNQSPSGAPSDSLDPRPSVSV